MEALKQKIAHEENMLKQWNNGDASLLPLEWSITQQKAFIQGMEHAKNIMLTHEKCTDCNKAPKLPLWTVCKECLEKLAN